jgi:cytoskeletal protein CcmA (bactofilin family)
MAGTSQTQPFSGWIGTGAEYRGNLTWRGRVRIDGHLWGHLNSDDLLDLGVNGRIEGDVWVAQALVGGVLVGQLVATERVTLLETAVVKGEIVTPWLDVRMGAKIEARIVVARGDPSAPE